MSETGYRNVRSGQPESNAGVIVAVIIIIIIIVGVVAGLIYYYVIRKKKSSSTTAPTTSSSGSNGNTTNTTVPSGGGNGGNTTAPSGGGGNGGNTTGPSGGGSGGSTSAPTTAPSGVPNPDISNMVTMGNCSGTQCDGLYWNNTGSGQWNGYYRIRCEKDGKYSDWSKEFGPYSWVNYHNPAVKIISSASTACPSDMKIAVQRRRTNYEQYKTINPVDYAGTAPFTNGSIFYDLQD